MLANRLIKRPPILWLITIITFSTSMVNAQTSWKTFKHPLHKYSISYPPDWALNNMTAVMSFVPPIKSGDSLPAESVNIALDNRKEEPITLDKLAEEYLDQIKQLMGAAGKVKQSKTTIGGLPAVKFDELFEAQGIKQHVNQYIVMKSNIAYIITFNALQTTYPKYQPTAQKIIDSFKLGTEDSKSAQKKRTGNSK